MVRFRIDIEAVAGDPNPLSILLKDEKNHATEAEETATRRLLPALRDLLKTHFPESDESQKPDAEEIPSPH